MLFDQRFWPGIADGSVTLAFRRWKRPTVRAGGSLRSPVGELAIESVEVVDETAITEDDARRAGFESYDELVLEMNSREGTLYRIAFHLIGPDRRIALREQAELSVEELTALSDRLDRMDRGGPWRWKSLALSATTPARGLPIWRR